MSNRIAILFPAYNEEKNIQIVIRESKKYLPHSKIIVIDDGSSDRTGILAKRMGVIVLTHRKNMGKGEALNTGFKYVLKHKNIEIVLIADADRQYSIRESKKLIRPLINNEADIVMGYRLPRNMPLANRVGNFIWRTLFNFFFGMKLKDTNCGYMALTVDAVKKIKRVHGGYIVENSILAQAVRNNLRIKQVPVSVTYRERKILKSIKMFSGVLFFIILEGMKFILREC